MIIIGITGGIEHGKSTLASFLSETEPNSIVLETSLIVSEVANELNKNTKSPPNPKSIKDINNFLEPLPKIIADVTHAKLTFEQIKVSKPLTDTSLSDYERLLVYLDKVQTNPELISSNITIENKTNYRAILQWLGGYLVQNVDKNIWYKEILRRLKTAASRGASLGIIGGLRYPNDGKLVHNAGGVIIDIYRPNYEDLELNDLTEKDRSKIAVDLKIVNDSSIEALKTCAGKVYDDIKNNKIKTVYFASKMPL
jgi:hypothetical protein